MLKMKVMNVLIFGMLIVNIVYSAEKQLTSFENAEEEFRKRESTVTTFSDFWKTDGEKSMQITFQKYTKGDEQWPGVILERRNDALSRSTSITVDTFNPQKEDVVLYLHIRDSKTTRYSQEFTLKGMSENRLSLDLKDITGLDYDNITQIHFFAPRPEKTFTVYVDNLRYTIDNKKTAEELLKHCDEINNSINKIELKKLKKVSADYQKDLLKFSELKSSLQKIIETNNGNWETAISVSEELEEIEENLKDFQNLYGYLYIAAEASENKSPDIILEPASSMNKIFADKSLYKEKKPFKPFIQLAQNEYEGMQVAVIPAYDSLKNLKWNVSKFTNKDGIELECEINLVGHLKTQKPAYKVDHIGWWPDILMTDVVSMKELPYSEIMTLWLTFASKTDQTPGVYSGKLTVSADNVPASSIDIKVEVWNFALPKKSSLETSMNVSRRHFEKFYGDKSDDMIRDYEDWLLDKYRLNPTDLYYGMKVAKWSTERLSELTEKGMDHVNISFMTTYRKDHADFSYKTFSDRVDKEIREMDRYMPVIKRAGAEQYAYMYVFDEYPDMKLVIEAAKKFKEKYPDVKTLTTAFCTYDQETVDLNTGPDGKKYIDYWCPINMKYFENLDAIEMLKKQGEKFWWYTCAGAEAPFTSFYLEYPGIDPRMQLGLMTVKYRPEGFLYYAMNASYKHNDKFVSGTSHKTDVNAKGHSNHLGIYNGDGSLTYPGKDGTLSSIRLENVRDGLEDYEYYVLLENILKSRNLPVKELDVSKEAMVSLKEYTKDPEVLYKERKRIADLILKYNREK